MLRGMKISVSAQRHIAAPADRVYRYITDFREHHPKFLPPPFGDLEIETGGVGAGTVHRFSMTLGGRRTEYRVRVGEPEPGRVLIESDPSRLMLTTFTVDRELDGTSTVTIHTRWYTPGSAGLVERLVAPRLLRRVYRAELALLDRYARETVPSPLPTRRRAVVRLSASPVSGLDGPRVVNRRRGSHQRALGSVLTPL